MSEKDDIDDLTEFRPGYIYIGPKFLVDLKIRFGKWLEERRME